MGQDTPHYGAIFGSSLLDASGQPNLVTGSSQSHELIWTLVNNQEQDLVVTPFDSSKVDQDQYHFRFDFAPGALTGAPTLQGWAVYALKDGKGGIKSLYVALSGSEPLRIKPGGNHPATLTYADAIQEDSNNSKVAVTLTTGQRVALGDNPIPGRFFRLFDLTLVQADTPTVSAPPLAVDFVGRRTVLNDGKTPNSFTFALTNMMQADLTLTPKVVFTVWFDAAPNQSAEGYPWALARVQDLASTDVHLTYPTGWELDKPPDATEAAPATPVAPQWKIKVSEAIVLKPQDPVLFTFSGIRTDLDPGVTRMYLRFESLPGFRPGVLIAELEKTPLLYGLTRGQGLYLSAGKPQANTPPAPNYDSGLYVQQFGDGAAAIFNGGRVGIGTAKPGSSLSVDGGAAIGKSYAQNTTTVAENNLAVEGSVGIGTTTPGSALSVDGGVAIGKSYAQKNTTVAENSLAVEGSVGIGITKPESQLHVKSGNGIRLSLEGNGGGQLFISNANNDKSVQLVAIGHTETDGKYESADLLYIGGWATPHPQLPKMVLNAKEVEIQATTTVFDGKVSATGLALTGGLTISGEKDVNNVLWFGFGVKDREVSAGKIGYRVFSDGLDIVGAGDTGKTRRVHLWDDVDVNGKVNAAGLVLTGGLKMNQANGVIQRGDGDIKTGDLGLYSTGGGNWLRFVTNQGHFKFFSDGGAGTNPVLTITSAGDLVVEGEIWKNMGGTYRFLGEYGGSWGGVWWHDGTVPSDVRLKREVQTVHSALDKIRRLCGVTFRWNENALQHFTRDVETTFSAGPNATEQENQKLWQTERDKRYERLATTHVGVIAQEVEAVLPEAVTTDADGYKLVRYDNLIPLLIEAIKEQDQLAARQQTEIERLKQALLTTNPQHTR